MQPSATKVKRKAIKSITTDTSYVDLEGMLPMAGDEAFVHTQTIKLSDIRIADKVFQWRVEGYNVIAGREHTTDLMRVLSDGTPLDPILVMAVGSNVFVVDGHHRYQAYVSQGWLKPVPVEWFRGTLADGRDEALRRNNRNKLPMTAMDRMEAAWALVKQGDVSTPGGLSKETIRARTAVSLAQIGIMRKRWRSDPVGMQEVTWRKLKLGQWDDKGPYDHDAWLEEAVLKMREKIDKHLYRDIRRHPEVFCEALEALNPELPRSMVEHWFRLATEVVECNEAEIDESGLDI